jgi:hypothetical protein
MDLAGRRKNATRETTATLKAWLYEHRKNPYPTKSEKVYLAIMTKMTLTQVSTWFANARRRLKKENKMTWSPRNRFHSSIFFCYFYWIDILFLEQMMMMMIDKLENRIVQSQMMNQILHQFKRI